MTHVAQVGAGSSYLPDQIKENFTDDDYVSTLRFIASAWNQYVYLSNPYSLPQNEIGLPLGFAQRALIWRDYYFGIQRNVDYDSYTLKEDGTRKLLKMFRGKDIFKYINYIQENIIDISKRIPKVVSCITVSENVVSQRRFAQDFEKFLRDQQQMTVYLNQQFGAYFKTSSGMKFMQNAQDQLGSVDARENLDEAAVNSARDIYYRNHLDEVFVAAGRDASITGLAGCKVEIENGYPLVEWIPSYEAIFPMTMSGDQHRTDPYGGRLRFLTTQEIAAKYGKWLSSETLKEIQEYAKSGENMTIGGWGYYNTAPIGATNFMWYSSIDGVPRIAVVEGQWASYKKTDSEEHRQCKREGILIGNRWLIKQGISTNQTKDWRSATSTDLDWIFCQPMNVFGKNMGIPEILYTYQNKIDAWETKLDEWTAQTKGTFYIINGAYLDPGVDATQIMAQVSDTRVYVSKGMDTDAGDTASKLMEQGAIEMPRDYVNLINRIDMFNRKMDDVLNIPAPARGQLEGYQGTKTLNMQISQSNKGTRYFYDPLYTFYQRVIQKAVDKFKISTLDNKDIEYTLIVSDSQVTQFKATPDFGYSQQSIYIGFDDIADDGYKQRQMEWVFAVAQNPQSGYTMTDYATIEAMYTKSEIRNYLQARDFEIAQQKAAEAQAAAQENMAKTQEINNAQKEITAMNIQAKEDSDNRNNSTKENIQAMKSETDLELMAMEIENQPEEEES